MRLTALPLLAAAFCALPAMAIQTRPDRDDEEYRELATRYRSAVALPGGGAGVLIAPRWILTTAHRARNGALGAPKAAIPVSAKAYPIQRAWVHPEFATRPEADIALFFLAEAVAGIEPTPIYRQQDEAEHAIRIVGFGPSGPVGRAPVAADGRARAAINTVDRVLPRELSMRLKGPEDASDLQGAETVGDSGGPGLIEVARQPYVAGLLLPPSRSGVAAVGDWTRLVRVSAFAEWIDDVMGRAALEEAAAIRPAKAPPTLR